MSEEINAIVNNLCDKLGTSAKLLIPELARLRVVESVTLLIIFFVILVIGLYFLPKAWKYDHREKKRWYDDSFFTAVPACIIFIGVIGIIPSLFSLVGWLTSPTAKAVLEIIGAMR